MERGRIITAIILFWLTIVTSAQKPEKRTVILHGGSRITGAIMADSSGFLKLRISSPQVLTLKKSDISLTTVPHKIERPVFDRHGYTIGLSTSVLAGRTGSSKIRDLSIHISNGYRFRSGIITGIGAGIEKLDVAILPVYADLRFDPLKTRLSPFFWVKTGYAFPLAEKSQNQYYAYGSYPETRGGFMFSTGTGLALYSWQRSAVTLGIGYRRQVISYIPENPRSGFIHNELVTYFNRLEIQFGLIIR
jgi:hypothetical protein